MRIFLSSTSYDLYDVRAFVIDELQKEGHEVIYHENATFPVHFGHSHDECLEAVKKCDVVLCILDRRYGGHYRGNGASYITDQTLKIKYRDESGSTIAEDVTIPAKDLSITWCELLTAFEYKKPVMTFARKRMLDEKHTRRENQQNKKFRTAYVDSNLIFDFADWITKQPRSNWIAGFDNIVDLRAMLLRWSTALKAEFVVGRSSSTSAIDNKSHIAIIVEGGLDRRFVRSLIQRLDLQSFFAISIGGGATIVEHVRRSLMDSMQEQYDKVIVLADADIKDRFLVLGENLSKEKNVHLVFADPELETWLAAGLDPELFNECKGRVTREDVIKKYGAISSTSFYGRLSHYDVDSAKELIPELARFIGLISDTGGN